MKNRAEFSKPFANWRLRFIIIILMIMGFFAMFIISQNGSLYNRPVTTTLITGNAPYRPMASDTEIIQEFTCTPMQLEQITLSVTTYGRINKSEFKLQLYRGDALHDEIIVDASTLEDNSNFEWQLSKPLHVAEEEQLALHISTGEVEENNEVALICLMPQQVYGTALYFNGERETEGTLAFFAQGSYTSTSAFIALIAIAATFVMVLLVLYGWCLYCSKRDKSSVALALVTGETALKNRQIVQHLLYSGLLLLLVACVYWQYILRVRYFVFYDAANDSYAQTLPYMMDTARNFWQGGALPGYNLLVNLGAPSGGNNPYNLLITMFGVDSIPYLLGIFQAVKVFLAGFIFYFFLRQAGFCYLTTVIGGLAYAFCGPMMLHSSWASYPNEIVCTALVLLTLELFFEKRNWVFFPLAFAFFAVCTDILRTTVYAAVFLAYSGFRYVLDTEVFKWNAFLKRIGGVVLLELLGILLSVAVIAPTALGVFSSNRLQSSLAPENQTWKLFSSPQTLKNSVLRLFSNTILGDGSYSTAQNFLDYPSFYIGIINLLMLPQIFIKTTKKRKILYGIALGAAGAYVVFEGLRYLMNGLAKETFKISAFWIVVLLLYLSMMAWDRFLREGVMNSTLLYATGGGMLLLVYWTSQDTTVLITSAIVVAVFIVGGTMLLSWGKNTKSAAFKKILLGALAVELILTGYPTQNNRGTLYPNSFGTIMTDRNAVKLVESLKTGPEDYFRISYPTSELCASLAQGYMSTTSYVGGSGLPNGYKELMDTVAGSAPLRIEYTPYFTYGHNSMRSINTLFGVKYMVQQKSEGHSMYKPYGYTEIPNDKFWIYQNENALPLAFTYDAVMSEDAFEYFNKADRREYLLQAAVVANDSSLLSENSQLDQLRSFSSPMWQFLDEGSLPLTVQSFQQVENAPAVEIFLQQTATMPYLILHANIEAVEMDYYDQNKVFIDWAYVGMDYDIRNRLEYTMSSGDDVIFLELPAENVDRIRVSCDKNCNFIDVIHVSQVDERFFEAYRTNVEARKEDPVSITRLENNRVECTVTVEESKLLHLSLCNTPGWKATVNGADAEIHTLNYGFMGVLLSEGENTVVFTYSPPLQNIIIGMNLLAIGVYLIFSVAWFIKKHKGQNLKEDNGLTA